MATPMAAVTLAEALKREGLTVKGVRNWESHNRNHKGKWGPVNGVMIHHTVTKGTAKTVDICYDGYSSLPGPLCHGVIGKDGVVYLVSSGRANHAGAGDDDVLDAVIGERKLPIDNEANTDGNARFYGFECENLGDGRDPWPDVQLEAIIKAATAICRHYGWTAKSVIGHKEWQPGKIDPKGFEMDWLREQIEKRLGYNQTKEQQQAEEAKPYPKPKPAPVYAPFPGAGYFKIGRTSKLVTSLGKALVKAGWKGYKFGPGPVFTATDRKAVAWFQRKQGWTGSDADGYPGPETWKRLKVPKS